MNISFQGKLTFDKSFYNLKHSNCAEIEKYVSKLYERPKLINLIPDTVIFGRGGKTKDSVVIRFGKDWDIPIVPKKEVSAGSVMHQILLNTCFYNGEQPLTSSVEHIKKSLIKIVQRNLDAK